MADPSDTPDSPTGDATVGDGERQPGAPRPEAEQPSQTPGASPTPMGNVPTGPSSETTPADVPATDENNPVNETITASDSDGTESGQTAPLAQSAEVDPDATAGGASGEVLSGDLAAADAAAVPAGTAAAASGAADPDEMGSEATGVNYAEEMGLTLGGGRPPEEIAPPPEALIRGSVDRFGTAMGTGRRKTSVARVRISDGSGQFVVNGRELDDYLTFDRDRALVRAPLEKTETAENVDVWVRVEGGGSTGQTGAIVLGIARALQAKDPNLHGQLQYGGFLTRDERAVERKKYGRAKARRSFQFSKR